MKNDPLFTSLFQTSPDQQTLAMWEAAGFRLGDKGTHTSRTIMLEELGALLKAAPRDAVRADYRALIVEQNALGKRTLSTRKLSDQRLHELYGLDPSVPLFRVMRQLWWMDEQGRPLLALLAALARDPLLRVTAPPILAFRPGEEIARQRLKDALTQSTSSRLNESVLDKVIRNAAASWTQSGHVKGRSRKVRRAVHPTPAVTTFALLLGYILGARGIGLFETLWAKVLDASRDELIGLATDGKRIGYLDLKVSGGVVEVSLSRLLTEEERRLIHGTN